MILANLDRRFVRKEMHRTISAQHALESYICKVGKSSIFVSATFLGAGQVRKVIIAFIGANFFLYIVELISKPLKGKGLRSVTFYIYQNHCQRL